MHEVDLTDGSHLSGIVTGDSMEFSSRLLGRDHPLRLPLSGVARFQIAVADSGKAAPTTQPGSSPATNPHTPRPTPLAESDLPHLALAGSDRLVGSLTGHLSLDTAFATIDVDANQIAELRRTGDGSTEIQLTLWDGATASGRLRDDHIQCLLKCGVQASVPAAIVEEYVQPFPQPPPKVLAEVTALVAELDADDPLRTDRAAEALKKMGPRITGALRTLRDSHNQGAQARRSGFGKFPDARHGG